MQNRITHLLKDWNPQLPPEITEAPPIDRAGSRYPLPGGINMLMPAELCINRDLLIRLLSASIQAMHQHREAANSRVTDRALAQLEAALHQQLVFRDWALRHPSTYISIAMYPTSEVGMVEDPEDSEEF